jgi:hypothetical protein
LSTTIHYFGKIKSTEAIKELQDEFYEIAQVSGWTHEMVDHVFAQEGDLQGNRLTLQGVRLVLNRQTTPLQLTFDKDGYLSHIYYEKAPVEMGDLMSKNGVPGGTRQLLHQIHTSTTVRSQDPQSHKALVKILDYVKKRYVPNLEVIDNTGYWYSRDEAVLNVPSKMELIKK